MIETQIDPALVQDFLIEAEETISNLGTDLIQLEEDPDNPDLINRMFRAAHGIKGISAMFGFTKITELTHKMENVLDKIRNKTLQVTIPVVDLLLLSQDKIKELMDELRNPDLLVEISEVVNRLIAAEKGELAESAKTAAPSTAPSEVIIEESEFHPEIRGLVTKKHRDEMVEEIRKGNKILQIRLNLKGVALHPEFNPITLARMIDLFGNLVVSTHISKGVPELEDFDPHRPLFTFIFLVGTSAPEQRIKDAFETLVEVEEIRKISFTVRDLEQTVEPEVESKPEEQKEADRAREEAKKIGELLIEKGKITKSDLEDALRDQNQQRFVGEILVDTGKISKKELDEILSQQKKKGASPASSSLIRVDQDKMDRFMNLIGEQTIITNSVSKISKVLGRLVQPEYEQFIKELGNVSITGERIVDELQRTILNVRMVPLKTIFQNLNRIIRDITTKQKKKIRLELEGEDIELDKTIVDQLNEPMIHIIRNAADHGIEPPEKRRQISKEETGTIRVRVSQKGKNVEIQVEDDGAGIDPEKVKAKAVKSGLIDTTRAKTMSDKETYLLIMKPGFSTVEQLSDISGRGVGMDSVLTTVNVLGGSFDIDSKLGSGTTFRLSLPVNIGILEKMLVRALLVQSGENQFAIPVGTVVETLSISRETFHRMRNRDAITIRGMVLGVTRLSDIIDLDRFGLNNGSRHETNDQDQVNIVVVRGEEFRLGLEVDRLLGQQEIVIKELQGYLSTIPCVSGATILGDGRVVLILNTPALIEMAMQAGIPISG